MSRRLAALALALAGAAVIVAAVAQWAERGEPVMASPVVSTSCSAESSLLVNINTASLAELESLPEIGKAKAQAIIDFRTANGLFVEKEDIMLVSGIGESVFKQIRNLITL